jgi:NTP pyrophosphatase (non-canonical NTP hydrolase)
MTNITNQEYLEFTRTTAIYPKDRELEYLVLGLTSEAGEVAGKLKKVIRDQKELTTNIKGTIIDECSDVLWYLTRIADVMGITLTELIQINHSKLASRKERGVIGGSGDTR